ncbi:MAG: macA [Cyanobacteria bacterium RYN_339]|nr:macA [Cyanobacteria bacterium RYN_339]
MMIALPPLPGRPMLAIAFVALCVTATLQTWTHPPVDATSTEAVVRGQFVVALKGSGDLIPAQRHMVAAPFSSKLDKLVDEGKEVKAGDVVAQLNTQDLEEQKQEEELHLASLGKDAQLHALTAERDRKKLLTDRRGAVDLLALRRLELKQLEAGTRKADVAELELKAAATARAFTTAEEEFKLQDVLLAKGVIRPIDLDKTKVLLAEARRAREVAASALAIAKNGYPDAQVTAARLAVQQARNGLALVEGKLGSIARTSLMDAATLAADRDFSRSRVQLLQHRIATAALKAPTNGVVVMNAVWGNGGRKKLQVGDEARENAAFMEVADVSRIFIKTVIKEVDIGRVKAGMPAKIHVESLNKTFDGKLEKLGVLAYEKPDVINREGAPKVFEGLITTNERSPAFRPGMSVTVELLVETLADVITVPNKALATRNGETTVGVYRPGRAPEQRVVTAGAHTEERTVITQGLAAGERIMLEAP